MTDQKRHPVTGLLMTRRCTVCEEEKDRWTGFGKGSKICRACVVVRRTQLRTERMDRYAAAMAEDATAPDVVQYHPVTGKVLTKACTQCGRQRLIAGGFVRWRTICKVCYNAHHREETRRKRERERERVAAQREAIAQTPPGKRPPILTFPPEDSAAEPRTVPWINPIRARALGLSQTPLRKLPTSRA